MKTEYIDCVKMKHDIQELLYKEIKANSIDEYFQKLSQKALKSKLWKELVEK